MNRKLTPADKEGKGLVAVEASEEAPRRARVRVQEPDLLRKHSLTLIGKVTNPSVQKVPSLIPFFTNHWKTKEITTVGSDLGHGLFQFQFDSESDLLAVLEQRPFHFAKWMVILQRWEPTISPSFPSLIPFWIKVEGIPAHLRTEETIRSIGEDIGRFECSDIISTLSARMRVHVNGRLPLIKSSVIEYPNGDEVTASLVYEKLEKHCSHCYRLDHGVRDCLAAKHQKKKKANALAETVPSNSHNGSKHQKKNTKNRTNDGSKANNNAVPQAGVSSLTPEELLATLASFLPQPESRQTIIMSGTSTLVSTVPQYSGGEAPPQAWHRDSQKTTHDDASNQLYHYNAAGQLPPPPRYYSSGGMVRGRGQSFNMPLNNYDVYTHGGSSNHHMIQQHQPEGSVQNINYGPVSSYQEANCHGVTTNQAHRFLNPSRFPAAMHPPPDKANLEPQSQPSRLRPIMLSGDVEKDERYQRTLQFAASLLHQINQNQQQPPLGTLAGHGP